MPKRIQVVMLIMAAIVGIGTGVLHGGPASASVSSVHTAVSDPCARKLLNSSTWQTVLGSLPPVNSVQANRTYELNLRWLSRDGRSFNAMVRAFDGGPSSQSYIYRVRNGRVTARYPNILDSTGKYQQRYRRYFPVLEQVAAIFASTSASRQGLRPNIDGSDQSQTCIRESQVD